MSEYDDVTSVAHAPSSQAVLALPLCAVFGPRYAMRPIGAFLRNKLVSRRDSRDLQIQRAALSS